MTGKNYNILCLEDNPDDFELIKSNLLGSNLGFNIVNISCEKDYIEALKNGKFDIVLADYSLPSFNGLKALKILMDIKPDVPLIIVSGAIGEDLAIESLKSGARDYILKNQLVKLAPAINRALKECEEIRRRKAAEEKLFLSYEKLTRVFDQIVDAFSSLSEKKDPYTAGHQRNVSLIACGIAEELGLDKNKTEGLRIAGLLHDIGKIHVPAEILSKPGKLNEYEFNIIKTHPMAGYDILKTIKFPWPVAIIVLQHHERLDGTGYCSGIRADDMLIESKILGVADVLEAMVSHRPYRPSLGLDTALEELTSKRGTKFDADVVDAAVKMFTQKDSGIKQAINY